jgi:hypothetical protein
MVPCPIAGIDISAIKKRTIPVFLLKSEIRFILKFLPIKTFIVIDDI